MPEKLQLLLSLLSKKQARSSHRIVEAKETSNVPNFSVCSCESGKRECKAALERYYNDVNAPYPKGRDNIHLSFKIENPKVHRPDSRRVNQAALRQQFYDRIVQVLNIPNSEKRGHIYVGVHHYHRAAIEHFLINPRRGKAKFIDYLLPKELVGNGKDGKPQLGREFTDEDLINCIGTMVEKNSCKKAKKCSCNL